MAGQIPPPRAQSFVICTDIYEDARTQKCILVAPFGGLSLSRFPAAFRLSIYADLCEGHGSYHLSLELRDADMDVVWQWPWPQPTLHDNPLEPHHVILHGARVEFPSAGTYELVLLANGIDVARHKLVVQQISNG